MCLLQREVLPLSCGGVNGFDPGGEALPQLGPLTVPGPVPLHVKKVGAAACVLRAGTLAASDQMDPLFLPSNARKMLVHAKKNRGGGCHACNCPHALRHTDAALPLHRADHDDRGGRSNSLVLHRVRISHMQMGIVHGE